MRGFAAHLATLKVGFLAAISISDRASKIRQIAGGAATRSRSGRRQASGESNTSQIDAALLLALHDEHGDSRGLLHL